MSDRNPRQSKEIEELAALGQRISVARVKAGIKSNAKLARIVHVSEASMSAYVRGLQRPSREILQRIAQAVHMPEAWLLDGEGEPDAPQGIERRASDPAFTPESLNAPANFWALFVTLRMCQEWFQRIEETPSLRTVIDWIGPHYARARDLPDRPIELKDSESGNES